jgi:hypothetical protein
MIWLCWDVQVACSRACGEEYCSEECRASSWAQHHCLMCPKGPGDPTLPSSSSSGASTRYAYRSNSSCQVVYRLQMINWPLTWADCCSNLTQGPKQWAGNVNQPAALLCLAWCQYSFCWSWWQLHGCVKICAAAARAWEVCYPAAAPLSVMGC